ncbi:glycosyltransferase family 2 protein [Brevundimonas nasdae]|uniref:glycosyltransferase family 2 protein n=1 Tax=Brevundimonas nasdae TaxID=172043 RepID=UPI00068B3058|nr:glycosyltransferase family 2 protein [Brevundimonas nasdae]
MLISVVVCTRNRARQIGEFLESAAALTPPSGAAWELVLIDNGSTDGTAEAAGRFADRLPLRLFREERAGLSNARNAGVAQARGDYICWTDDDVLLDPQWLAEYAKAFVAQPDVALFGGPVRPRLIGDTPEWFHEGRPLLGGLLAERPDRPDGPIDLDHLERLPFGANFAVRSDAQRLETYDRELGVSPDFRRLGEETKVMIALLRRGYTAGWAPGAVVNHLIPEGRQTLAYVAQYFQSAAATSAFLTARGEADFINAGPAGRLSKRRFVRHAILYRAWRLLGRSRRWLYHFIELNRLKGFRDAMSGA